MCASCCLIERENIPYGVKQKSFDNAKLKALFESAQVSIKIAFKVTGENPLLNIETKEFW